MKYYNNKVIIGIDHGDGNIKTANHVFRTGVLQSDGEPLFTKNLLVYDGKYYTVGEGHTEFTADKQKDGDYYVLTGTNTNRPGFQSMLDDIDMGFVSVVMVKDLSRLGRDYVAVGSFLDSYFPEHGVRFIAVNDMVDSAEGENEIAPFKNVMNEMYARDISQKIKTSHRLRGNMGEPLSPPPYGYMKDPLTKKKWVIDPEAAGIVRDIFRMCLEGKGNETSVLSLYCKS